MLIKIDQMSFLTDFFGYNKEDNKDEQPFLENKRMESISNASSKEISEKAYELSGYVDTDIASVDFDHYIQNWHQIFTNQDTAWVFRRILKTYSSFETSNRKIRDSVFKIASFCIEPPECFFLKDVLPCQNFSREDKLNLIKMLNKNSVDDDGRSILFYYCSLEYLEVLLEAGVDPKIRDKRGNTFLYNWLDLDKTEIFTVKNFELFTKYNYYPDDKLFDLALTKGRIDLLLLIIRFMNTDKESFKSSNLKECIDSGKNLSKYFRFLEKVGFDFGSKLDSVSNMNIFTYLLFKGNYDYAKRVLNRKCVRFEDNQWLIHLCRGFTRNQIVEILNIILSQDKLSSDTLIRLYDIHLENKDLFYKNRTGEIVKKLIVLNDFGRIEYLLNFNDGNGETIVHKLASIRDKETLFFITKMTPLRFTANNDGYYPSDIYQQNKVISLLKKQE